MILRAVSRWRELWERVTCDMDEEVMLKAGLTRHCHENCTLVEHLVIFYQKTPDHAYFHTIGHNTLVPIYSLLLAADPPTAD